MPLAKAEPFFLQHLTTRPRVPRCWVRAISGKSMPCSPRDMDLQGWFPIKNACDLWQKFNISQVRDPALWKGDDNSKGCWVDWRGNILKSPIAKREVGKWGAPFLLCFPGKASGELVKKEAWLFHPKSKGPPTWKWVIWRQVRIQAPWVDDYK